MQGDCVEMVADAGDTMRTYEVITSRVDRRVETAVRRGVVEVSEVTLPHARLRSCEGTPIGSVVRTARFMENRANRVPALVEQPVPREDGSERDPWQKEHSGRPLREGPET